MEEKIGHVEDLIGEGRKPDRDDHDDDAPIHSVLGIEGMTNLTRAPESGHRDRGAGRAEAI